MAPETSEGTPKRSWTPPPPWLVLVVVATGLLLRLWILTSPLGEADADEAVVGLMAMDVLDGKVPAFYWGQAYGGTLDQILTAGVFAVVGVSVLALKAVQVALAGGACVLTWRVGRRIVGEGPARTGALLFWIAPAAYLLFSTKSRGWYWLGLCLALGVVLICLRLIERPGWLSTATLGLLLGLTWWTAPPAGFLALPAVVYAVVRRPRLILMAWVALPTFALGAAPWIGFNLGHDFLSLEQPPPLLATTYLDRLGRFFATALPMALGLKVPYAGTWLGGPLGPMAYLTALGAFVALAVAQARRRGLLLLLVVLAGAYPLLFALSPSTFYVSEPRYLLFLAPVLALLVAHRLTTLRRQAGALSAALVLSVASLVSLLSWVQDHPGNHDLTAGDLGPVLSVLQRDGVTAAWAGYWTAYRITFESEEEVIAASLDYVRHPPYQREVAERPTPAFVVHRGTGPDGRLGPALTDIGVGFERVPAGDFVVYLPAEAVDPVELEGVWR